MRRIVWPLWESFQISSRISTTAALSQLPMKHVGADIHTECSTGLLGAQLQPSYVRGFSAAAPQTDERKTPVFAMVPTQLDENSLKLLQAKEARRGGSLAQPRYFVNMRCKESST